MTLLDTRSGEVSEIVPGISVECHPGHTAQLMAINIDSGGRRACYISDLIPTSAHLDITWVMGYDLYPLRALNSGSGFIPGLFRRSGWCCLRMTITGR